MKTSDFDYHLPAELIASRPRERRDDSRMLVLDRASGEVRHLRFRDFGDFVRAGDLCVFNDTKVVPSRFFSDDGRVELVRTATLDACRWKAMVRPGRRMKPGREVTVGGVHGRVESVCGDGERIIRFESPVDESLGRLALPHYMEREPDGADRERYQTVFAREEGAIAAPTAGLHFTPELIAALPHAFVTLHVGVGTFRPVNVEEISRHRMHSERFVVGAAAAGRIAAARRVLAVGTTVARVLEHLGREHGGRVVPGAGETDIFISPGFEFRVTGALLTNFHLPRSTLLMLVCAFAGNEAVLEAYRQAVVERYRFYSYGDCMLIV